MHSEILVVDFLCDFVHIYKIYYSMVHMLEHADLLRYNVELSSCGNYYMSMLSVLWGWLVGWVFGGCAQNTLIIGM